MKNRTSINYIICSLICFFFININVFGEDYVYKQLTGKDGIPAMIRSIHVEKKGFIWIGTNSGLGRFDGTEYKQYNHSTDNINSLPSNHVYEIAEDSLRNIWILTDKGLCRYDRKQDNFIRLKNKEDRNLIAGSFCEYSGGLLFGARNEIYKYDYKTNEESSLYRFETENSYLINTLNTWNKDYLLCSNRWNGIVILDIKTGEKLSLPFDCGKDIRNVLIDSKNRVWISSYNNGVLCFDNKGQFLTSYTVENSDLSSNLVLCMEERDSLIWIGTDGGGINILDSEKKEIIVLERIPGNNNSLPSNSIYCLYNDNYNNIWAGSIRGGLISIREASMKTYTDVILGNDKGLSENTILSIYQGNDLNTLWIGTDGGGLNKLAINSGHFTHYPKMWGSKIASLSGFADGKLLLSVFMGGLHLFDPTTEKITPIYFSEDELKGGDFYSGTTVNLYQDSDESTLILSRLIYRYDFKSKKLKTVDNINFELMNGTVLGVSHNNDYTYIHDLNNLYELDKSLNQLKKILSCKGDTTFNSISQDGDGNFWIASNKGLSSFDLKTSKHQFISGLPSNEIHSVLCDKKGKVWVAGNQILFSWLINEKKFILFGEADGAGNNEYLSKPRLLSLNGDIFLGGVNGLLHINSDLPIETYQNVELRMTDIIVGGESTFNSIDTDLNSITLPFNSKTIHIKFMSCEENIFRQRLYKYMIPGYAEDIIETYNPELIIRSLPVGNYNILISCSTKNGGWTPFYSLLDITILPPWYKSWWFIIACAFVVLCVIFISFNSMIKRRESKLKWAMKDHEQKMYEDKVRFLINISHELRTPLTLIHAPLKRILKVLPNDDLIYPSINAIYRQSQRMKDLLNMVLDVRKMEVDNTTLNISLYSINEWVKEVADDYKIEADAKRIKLSYDLDSSINEIGFDKDKCIIILNNLLINALKYSHDSTIVTIQTALISDKDRIRISIIDQGDGLHKLDINKLFTRFYQGENKIGGTGIGLSYSKMLVELQGGEIGAFNNIDKGATFYFELPIYLESQVISCSPKPYLNDFIDSDEHQLQITSEKVSLQSFSILIVDDNSDLIDFLVDSLKDSFLNVFKAENGLEALNIIKTHKIDIVISDVMMPEMDGYELCKEVKGDIDVSHIIVILLTARCDEQSRKIGYKLGADAYLAKPFEMDTLQELIHNKLKNRENIKLRYKQIGLLPIPEETTFSSSDEEFLLKLNKLITNNIDNSNLDILYICREMGMSRTSLYNKIKTLTTMSISEYINKMRLEKAISLIITTDLTFVEISEKVGFSTARYFSTAFKQYTNKTPSQYRTENVSISKMA